MSSGQAASQWVGETFERRHRFDVCQVKRFAAEAGDLNPLHHDEDVAKAAFGQLIVSGAHTTALLLGLVASHFSKKSSVLGLAFSVQLVRPVFAEDDVVLRWEVKETVEHLCGGALLTLEGALLRDNGQMAVKADGRVLVNADLTALRH